jgi:dipeptidyl aminopeptidase/acylaminoacyl peptidase
LPIVRHALIAASISLPLIGCAEAPFTEAPKTEKTVEVRATLADGTTPTLTRPQRLGPCERGALGPTWTRAGEVVREIPIALRGLSRVQKPGLPIFDPSTSAWYASANGSLVRVGEERLPVIADGIQGIDIDVRADLGLAVSREPNDTIVLHHFAKEPPTRRVLLTGSSFFRPRFSRDGDAIVVSESKMGGGRIWVIDGDGQPRDVTGGTGPSWHPNGKRLVFARVLHDGKTILSSELWMVDAATGQERRVGTPSVPAVEPAISPDGTQLVFLDGRTRDVYLAHLDDPFQQGGR